jgi:undecaprenyl-diphosphatase
MSILEALLLGFIQGVTEFLPISSSGHLVIGQHLLEIKEPKLLFDIILHVGTLLAVVTYYWKDIREVIVGLFEGIAGFAKTRSLGTFAKPQGARLATLTLLATLPTGIIGLFLEGLIDPPEGSDPFITAKVVAGLLIINGFILFANRWLGQTPAKERDSMWSLWNITPAVAIGIGIAQGIAVMPGFSRAGLTITAALALGLVSVQAARFSFLISIPAILGALVLKFDLSTFTEASSQELLAFGAGAVTAAAVGYVSILVLVEMLKKARFHHFSWYCWVVGIAGVVLL